MTESIRLVIFDDSSDALRRYAASFAHIAIDYLTIRRPILDQEIQTALVAFQPDLIIVDLVMGSGRDDGYLLIDALQDVRFVSGMPSVVVCSKLITNSPMGEQEKARALKAPGVVAAFSKFPELPSAEQFLQFMRRRT